MTGGDLIALGQFGFAAVACYAVWKAYQELVPQLLNIIRQNSEAIEKFAAMLIVHTRSIDSLREAVNVLDGRMARIEEHADHRVGAAKGD